MLSSRSLVALVAISALAACGGDSTGPGGTGGGGGGGGGGITPVATTSVLISNSRFDPSAIVVAPSAVVSFTNSDGIGHNVIFDAGATSIQTFSSGTRTTTMPATPGTYTYSCTLHSGMNGSVKVQ